MAGVKLLLVLFALVLCCHGYFIEDTSVVEFDESSEVSDILDGEILESKKKCFCTEYSCHCLGRYKHLAVYVRLSVDEIEHHGHEHIVASVYINKVHFEKRFCANKLYDFCHRVRGKRYCFDVDVKDDGKENKLPGCIKMVKPVKLDLGCFQLPL